MTFTHRRRFAALALALLAGFSLGAGAQGAFPSQPIRIIVPFTPGTGMDTIARVVAPRLSERLGQSVVVQNQPGASGNIGAEAVARSAPDGHTVLMGANTMLMAAQMYKTVGFDPVKDFAPVSMAAYGTLMLVAHPKTGIKTVTELIKQAQARPGAISFGSPGIGTPHHMAMELLKLESGTFMLHVPYRGSAGYTQDLLGGEVSQVSSIASKLSPVGAEVDDQSMSLVKFANGTVAYVGTCWTSPGIFSVRIFGSKGLMHYEVDFGTWDTPSNLHKTSSLYIQRGKDGYGKREVLEIPASDMFRDELEQFAQSCVTGTVPMLSAYNGNVAIAMMNAALRSIDGDGVLVSINDLMAEAARG